MSQFTYGYFGGWMGGIGGGGIPYASLNGLPDVAPDAPAKAGDPIDRSLAWSLPAAMSVMAGYESMPPASIEQFWQMRRYPTCTLAYAITVGPLLAGQQVIEVVDDGTAGMTDKLQKKNQLDNMAERKRLAEKDLLPLLAQAFEPATECLNFGAWLQEIVWARYQGRTVPAIARSFLPGEATIYQDKYRQFAGFQIGSQYRDNRYAFLAVNQRHVDPIFGYARAMHCRPEWWRAINSNTNADKLERKASGIHMMLSIPYGNTWKGPDGKAITSEATAQAYANFASTGTTWTVPRFAFTKTEIMAKPELAQLELVKAQPFDWGNPGPALLAHISRLDRIDKDIMRAWRRPEREAMQGTNGTQAEAGVHGQVGVNDSEIVAAMILAQFSEQIVDRYLVTNYGIDAKGSMRVKQSPLSDPQQAFLQAVANALIASPNDTEFKLQIDDRALAERVELPTRPKDEVEADIKAQEQEKQQQKDQQTALMTAKLNGGANGNGNKPPGQNGGGGSNGNGSGKPPGGGGGFGGRLKALALAGDGEMPRLHRWDRERYIEAARVEVSRQLPELLRGAAIALAADDGAVDVPAEDSELKISREVANKAMEAVQTMASSPPPVVNVHIDAPQQRKLKKVIKHNDKGKIIEICEQEIEADTEIALAADDGEGHWITINGEHVLIKDGKITSGPAALKGKVLGKDIHKPDATAAEISSRGGWKLHLATDHPEEVSKHLKESGFAHKVGHSGQAGKDLTVYVGHRDAADAAAKHISDHVGHLLKEPHGETVKDDQVMAPKVAGRFDVPRSDSEFHQYGAGGVPFLNEDVQARVFGGGTGPSIDEAKTKAHAALRKKYGAYYGGESSKAPVGKGAKQWDPAAIAAVESKTKV